MDKWQALHGFWESFDIPAYDENSVPEDASMPYITYSASVSAFEDPVSLSASIWYRSTSWEQISQKVDEIASYIGSYRLLPLGSREYVMVTKGSPFAQRMGGGEDAVRRMYVLIIAEYLSAY